jgi:hypothetical protein
MAHYSAGGRAMKQGTSGARGAAGVSRMGVNRGSIKGRQGTPTTQSTTQGKAKGSGRGRSY